MKKLSLFLSVFLVVNLVLGIVIFGVPSVQADPDEFGYTTKGGTPAAWAQNYIIGCKFPMTVAGVGVSITAWLYASHGYLHKVRFALYDESLNFVAETDEWVLTSGYNNWKTLALTTSPDLTIQDYWIAVWWDRDRITIYYIGGSGGQSGYKSLTYDGFPASITWGAESRQYSFYCTYEPSAQEYDRSASQGISVSLAASRTLEATRGVTQALGVVLEATGMIGVFRSASQAIGIALEGERLIEVTRQVTQNIGVSVVADRLIEVSRAVTQGISFVLEGSKERLLEAVATLGLLWGSEVMWGDIAEPDLTDAADLAVILLTSFILVPMLILILWALSRRR